MARITASVYTSQVPAIGAAIDLGKTTESYWKEFTRPHRQASTKNLVAMTCR
jgi:hypothetical protein